MLTAQGFMCDRLGVANFDVAGSQHATYQEHVEGGIEVSLSASLEIVDGFQWR